MLLDIASGEILYKIQDGYSLKWLYNRFPKTNHITWPLGFLPGSKDTCIIQVPPKTASGEPEAWLEVGQTGNTATLGPASLNDGVGEQELHSTHHALLWLADPKT